MTNKQYVLCSPRHIAYLARAAEGYGVNELDGDTSLVCRLAMCNWLRSHSWRADGLSDYIAACEEAYVREPRVEEGDRPVLTLAACHWYSANSQSGDKEVLRLVDALIVSASYQLPCMEEECGIL